MHQDDSLESSVSGRDTAAHIERGQKFRRQAGPPDNNATDILESITDSYISVDRDWSFTYLNGRAEKIIAPLNKSRSNLIGKNCWAEFPDLVGTELEQKLRRAFSENTVEEFEYFCPGLNLWLSIRCHPSRDGLALYFLDVTSKKRVLNSEAELRALADSIPQLTFMAHPDGEVFWYNRGWYEYTGTTLEQMQGWGWQTVHDPLVLPSVIERWTESIRNESAFEMEFPIRGADGVFRWFLTRISPFRDEQGRMTRWFGTGTNVHEQRQLLQSLSDARDHLEKRVAERTAALATANESLRDLSLRLLQVQDDERRRLARELHDSVGQLLAAIGINVGIVQSQANKLDARGARAVSENAQLLDQVSREIRTISHLLHPPLLEIAGLASALRWYVDGFAERSGIKVDIDLPENLERLPNDTELAIFRIVQECLTNIHRHSGSETAKISLRHGEGGLIVQVEDFGKGIAESTERERSQTNRPGIGFGGMRERVRQLGGTLEVTSLGTGTKVCAILKVV